VDSIFQKLKYHIFNTKILFLDIFNIRIIRILFYYIDIIHFKLKTKCHNSEMYNWKQV
jgi:hypothetical protein